MAGSHAAANRRARGRSIMGEATTLDVLALLNAMAAALTGAAPLEWDSIGPAIGLRFDSVTAIGRSDAASAIVGGTLIDDDAPIEGVIYKTPPRRISIFFPSKTVSDPEIARRVFAPEQRIVPSSAGGGYAVVFNIGDVECAVLASDPGGVIDGLTASEMRRTGDAQAKRDRRSSLG